VRQLGHLNTGRERLEAVAIGAKAEQIGIVEAILAVAAGEAQYTLVVVEADHGRTWGRGK
jgi:hypothetical protein